MLGVVASLIGTSAHAQHLGEMTGKTVIGERLQASIGIVTGSQSLGGAVAVDVLPDPLYRHLPQSNHIIEGLRGEVIHDGSGSRILVTSAGPVNEPMLAFRVRLRGDGFSLSRSYAVILERPPPVLAQRPPAVQRPAIKSAGPPVRAGPAAADGSTYGPVRSGESLWRIAQSIRAASGGSMQDIMRRIAESNPQAFVHGDMNKLRAGSVLVLPAALAAADVAPPALAQASAHTLGMPRTAVSTPLADSGPAPSARAVKVDWRERNPQLAAELSRLDAKFALARARINALERQSSASAAAEAPAVVEAPPPARAPVEAAAVIAVEDSARVVKAEQTVVAAAATDAPAPAKHAGGPLGENLPFGRLVLGAGLLALLVVAARYIRAHVRVDDQRKQESLRRDLDADRKLEVSRKAQRRLEIEAEVKQIVADHEKTKRMMRDAGMEAKRVDDYEDEMTEIDLDITHGRYKHAEALLKYVIAEAPRNYRAKLRLAEVYYITDRPADFLRAAQDLRDHHRRDIADDDWQKIVRMGKIACPNEPLFGALAPVGRTSRAS
jgi:pilus assembly protein FimV